MHRPVLYSVSNGLLWGRQPPGNPPLLPLSGLTTLAENTVYNERCGRVEVLVKSNHPALIDQINAGAGSIVTAAFDTAGVPATDRPTRIIQLQSDLGLY